jgi:hypothetical protein
MKPPHIMASRIGLAALLGLCTVLAGGACGSSGIKTGSGGTAGGAAGGAGGTTPATGGDIGGGGAGGTTPATGGDIGSGGAGCGPKCTSVSTCEPSVVPGGLTTLTDFSSNLDAKNFFHTGGINDWTSLFGGTWIAPKASDPCATTVAPYPLAESFTDGNWHITGTIGSAHWAGAGLWFGTQCPVMDFRAYQGISFTIAGDAGPSGSVSVSISTAANSQPNTDTTSANFTCFSNAATCTAATCTPASRTVTNITRTAQTVRVLWADLTNGVPSPTPDPAEITGIGITPTIDWSGNGSPYSLDLIIDDLALIP